MKGNRLACFIRNAILFYIYLCYTAHLQIHGFRINPVRNRHIGTVIRLDCHLDAAVFFAQTIIKPASLLGSRNLHLDIPHRGQCLRH